MYRYSDGLVIEVADTASSWSQGLGFVDFHYRKVFGVRPSPPDHLLLARQGERIVASMGINVAQAGGLRLERLYQFDRAQVPMTLDTEHAVEFGRWVCDAPRISPALVHASICFCLSLGKAHVWCEHTPAVNRNCRRLGIVFHHIEGAQVDASQIEEHHRLFYERNDAHLYLFELAPARSALESYLARQSLPEDTKVAA